MRSQEQEDQLTTKQVLDLARKRVLTNITEVSDAKREVSNFSTKRSLPYKAAQDDPCFEVSADERPTQYVH